MIKSSFPLNSSRHLRRIEPLEARIAPAVHVWTGLGGDNLWSNGANWTNGSPATDASGDIDLVFSTNLVITAQLQTLNDINSLIVDSITFNASAGTVGPTTFATGGLSTSGYTIDGQAIFINVGSMGQTPFGIDVTTGVANASGLTQTFNVDLVVINNNATFRTQDNNARLTFNGGLNLGGNTLTIDNVGINAGTIPGVTIHGDVSNGNLIKNGGGTLRLTGDNTYTNATFNNGVIIAESDDAFGANAGTLTINDPARVELRNGITVEKPVMNLNTNALGGFGADGNTTNTFRGNVVLMAGAGGVALGAGVGVANANTRLIIDGVISGGTSTLSLNGAGVIEFTKNNTFSGKVNHNGNNGFGALQIDAPGGLGAGGVDNETILNRNGAGPTGSALWLNFNGSLQDAGAVAERIQFAGSGVDSTGAIRSLANSNVTLPGNITFIAGAPWFFGVDGELGSITTTGVIDSQGTSRALTKVGAGTLMISGVNANTYLGTAGNAAVAPGLGTIVNGGTLNVANLSNNPLGVTPAMNNPNIVSLNPGTFLRGEAVFPNTVISNGATISPGLGTALTIGILQSGGLTLDAASTFRAELSGVNADRFIVSTGDVVLDGALDLRIGTAPTLGAQFTIIDKQSAGAITGTFAGLAEGDRFSRNGLAFTISYVGGDGNDVVLTTVALQTDLALSNGNKTATFTDVDGDKVTVTTSVGQFEAGDFTLLAVADNRQQLQRLALDADFTGAKISITAKPSAAGGNGFVNVGFLDATGVDLGDVTIAGDLARVFAGTMGGNASVPGLKSLTVQSLGLFFNSTQGMGGNSLTKIEGALPKLTVKGDVAGSVELLNVAEGKLGAVSIGGTLGGPITVKIEALAGIGSIKVGGDLRGGPATSVQILTGATIGSLQVAGSAGGGGSTVSILAFGQTTAPASGIDLAIGSLTVGGSVESLSMRVGQVGTNNADASIGSVSVGGDWIASNVTAGVTSGNDALFGNNNDAKLSGGATRDNPNIFSQIGSFVVKGQALGTAGGGDMFGIVAERIGKASVGGRIFGFVADVGATQNREAFFAAPTGPGTGAELPAFDFTIREIGSTTPTAAFGGANLLISDDGKTATFTDRDGDLVTVTRTAGQFEAGDFTLLPGANGGGQLQRLEITPAAFANLAVNLSITAKPSPDGGNGLVNIGEIDATGVPLGTVTIGGDLGRFVGGDSVGGKLGVTSFTARSIGLLGTSTGASSLESTFFDGAGKITIAGDVRGSLSTGGSVSKFGTVAINGSLVGGELNADRGITTVTIKGSVRAGQIISANGPLGTITIGGDLLGDGVNPTIAAFGQLLSPAKGPDVAIKTLDVKGGIANARIDAGIGTNADASIGKISVGREWLASSVRAGVSAGADGFLGTADDTKTTGALLRDRAGNFSTISSIIIKGQALGSAAAGDAFGLVAEQITAAKIGAFSLALTKGARHAADTFLAAPTRPGATGLDSDFIIREIVV